MKTQLVGTRITLPCEMVVDVGRDYVIVREPIAAAGGETVLVAVGASVKRWQSVEESFLKISLVQFKKLLI